LVNALDNSKPLLLYIF